MLLQPSSPKFPLNYYLQNHPPQKSAVSFSFGPLRDSTFLLRQPIIYTSYITYTNLVVASSISQVHSYGTVDYENRPMLTWNAIYKKISMLEDPTVGSASVLNQVENEGKGLTKWELCRIVKELRKFKRFKFALEVYEWMNNRPERFRITTSDTAIQLDLIAKVHGIKTAENYLLKLPDALKDKRIHGSLLNAYVRARMREKAESQMDELRNRGYARDALPFNVMMTLYANLKEHEKIEPLILEMREKRVPLDIYTYNIWLSSCGTQGSIEKMEQVFAQMQLDNTINPNWTTFSTMATMYIKLQHFEKAEDYLRRIESRITGRDRMPFHYLISLYGAAGKREEVNRVWNLYKASFVNVPNLGYHTVVAALIRLDDIDGVEKIYNEWLTVKTIYDPRLGNLLLGFYVRKGLSQKAETFFNQMIEVGGKPNSMTWEILSENHIRNMRIQEALSCLQNAASAEGSKNWKPKPANVSSILKICEQDQHSAIKDALVEVMRQVGCLVDEVYMSCVPTLSGTTSTNVVPTVEDGAESDGGEEEAYSLMKELPESL